MEDFYISLPSDGDLSTHPNNKAEQFEITLDSDIDLENAKYWEVALAEVTYTNRIKLFSKHLEDYYAVYIPKLIPDPKPMSDDIYFDAEGRTFPTIKDAENNPTRFWSKTYPLYERPGDDFVYKNVPISVTLDVTRLQWKAVWGEQVHFSSTQPVGEPLFTLSYNEKIRRFQFDTYFGKMWNTKVGLPLYWAYKLGFTELVKDEYQMKDKEWVEVVTIEDLAASITQESSHRTIVAHYRPAKQILTNKTRLFVRLLHYTTPYASLPCVPLEGYYKDVESLCNHLNEILTDQFELLKVPKCLQTIFSLDKETNRVVIKLPPHWSVELNGNLNRMLGFERRQIGKTSRGIWDPDLYWNMHNFHIHCNIIQPQAVGNKRLPIIRSIPHTVTQTQLQLSTAFETLRYMPLNTNVLRTLEIRLWSDTDVLIPFVDGAKSFVILHFRYRLSKV